MAPSSSSQVTVVAIVVPILVVAIGMMVFVAYKATQRARTRARAAPFEARVLVEGLYNETDMLRGYPRPISHSDSSFLSPPLPVYNCYDYRESTTTVNESLETAKEDVYHRMEEVQEILVEIKKMNEEGEEDSVRMRELMSRLMELTQPQTERALTPIRHPSVSGGNGSSGSSGSHRF